MSICTYLSNELDMELEQAKIWLTSRFLPMFRSKPKAYRVVLDGEIGGYSMMLVLGCADLDECIKHANKTKDKNQKIFDIQEIV